MLNRTRAVVVPAVLALGLAGAAMFAAPVCGHDHSVSVTSSAQVMTPSIYYHA